jgi:hypothetical protein
LPLNDTVAPMLSVAAAATVDSVAPTAPVLLGVVAAEVVLSGLVVLLSEAIDMRISFGRTADDRRLVQPC